MTWEWVSPLATAAVGLGGIAGTYLTGRAQGRSQVVILELQRRYQEQDARRNERKTAYLRFLAVTGREGSPLLLILQEGARNEQVNPKERTSPPNNSTNQDEVNRVASELEASLNELLLAAPQWVSIHARTVATRMLLWIAAPSPEERWQGFERFQFARMHFTMAAEADMRGETQNEFDTWWAKRPTSPLESSTSPSVAENPSPDPRTSGG